MTLSLSRFRALGLVALVTLSALPAVAATSKKHIIRPLPDVTVTGTVTEDPSGKPVKGVIVSNGVVFSTTDDSGTWSLKLPAGRPTLVSTSHFAYKNQTKTITPGAGATLGFALQSNPIITVKTTAGESVDLDYDTSKFAYIIVFVGYVKDDNGNFCKPNGDAWAPNKSEFVKITGPATNVNFSPCCTLGPITTANVEMKSGEKTAVYFNDSCFGNEVDFLGRERSSGNFRYFRFADIAEIDFP